MMFRHARRRLIERYGVWLEEKDFKNLVARIQKGEATFLGHESASRSHWLIDDQWIAVYHKPKKCIATFLPPEAIDNYLPLGQKKKWLFRSD